MADKKPIDEFKEKYKNFDNLHHDYVSLHKGLMLLYGIGIVLFLGWAISTFISQ